jgi:hypothetical protein
MAHSLLMQRERKESVPMLSKKIYSALAYVLIPAVLSQACGVHDPTLTEDTAEDLELGSGSVAFELRTLKGHSTRLELDRAELLQSLPVSMGAFQADGVRTQSPLALLTAKQSTLRTADGELRQIVRTDRTLTLQGSGKLASWSSNQLVLGDGDSTASLLFPSALSAQQVDALIGALAYNWFTDGGEPPEDPETHASWGAVIAILLILIGAVAGGAAAGQSCCERARSQCPEDCSFSCTPFGGGSVSVNIDGIEFETPTFCDYDCSCGTFGTGPAQDQSL